MSSEVAKLKTWIEIDRDNLIHNLQQLKKTINKNTQLMAVIKSNAYGHDIIKVSKICIQEGIDWFGVDSIDEALRLREEGINKPILILGYTLFSRLEDVINHDVDLIVYNKETIKKLGKATEKLKKKSHVHIKVETGTSRQGILKNKLIEFIELIKQFKYIKIRGISTHYANIEDATDHSYAEKQLNNFQEAINLLKNKGTNIPIKHTACSAAAILFPETHFDLVRTGISLYGLWSSEETKKSAQIKNKNIELKPCLTWKTKISQIKKIAKGTPVSYGLTEKVAKDTKIAILPIGYWDGYDRGLSSIGEVLIKGKRCKVLGRICMNITIVDISSIDNACLEDEVVLLVGQKNDCITVEEIAQKINTINYEITTRINPLIRRFYKKIYKYER